MIDLAAPTWYNALTASERMHEKAPGPHLQGSWLDTLARILAGAQTHSNGTPAEARGLAVTLEPFIAFSRAAVVDRLRHKLAAHGRGDPPEPLRGHLEDILPRDLPDALVSTSCRAHALSLNIARTRQELSGDTAAARFDDYCRKLTAPDALARWLSSYPVLARRLVDTTTQWIDTTSELLIALIEDWPDITRTIVRGTARGVPDGADLGPLTAISGPLGDKHRAGRAVRVLTFASGYRLVYKPRSLSVDAHFMALLAWWNERRPEFDFPITEIVSYADHGWMAWVAPRPCRDAREVERFYRRQGRFLALFHLLCATDMHYENVIAAGEYPVFVDLETLFHPRLGNQPQRDPFRAQTEDSVLRIGLLPLTQWSTTLKERADFSGLGTPHGQISPREGPAIVDGGTDAMRLELRRGVVPEGHHLPRLEGSPISVLEHSGEVIGGFEEMYGAMLEAREQLLAEDGPLAAFRRDTVRVLIRQTATYKAILDLMTHPDVLADATRLEACFAHLTRRDDQVLRAAAVTERRELLAHSVPLFVTTPDADALYAGDDSCVPDIPMQGGYERVTARLRGFNREDVARQTWLARAAIATLQSTDVHRSRTHRLATGDQGFDAGEVTAQAVRIAEHLGTLSLDTSEGRQWFGLTLVDRRAWGVSLLGGDLYNGLPGVALFLAYLSEVTGDPSHAALARGVIRSLTHRMDQLRMPVRCIGAFAGWGGIIYVLAHLSALWNDQELHARAVDVTRTLPNLIDADEDFDIIGGSAGCAAALLALHAARPAPECLEVAVRCGEHLLRSAHTLPQGIGWISSRESVPLGGLSHGAAGIGLALLMLARATGDARFRDAARASFAYDRTLFEPSLGNWQDLRTLTAGAATATDGAAAQMKSFMVTWCHGAPGIGLSRLLTLAELGDDLTANEIDVAIRTTLAAGFGFSHSLCHGDLGNLELLQAAAMFTTDPSAVARHRIYGGAICRSIAANGPMCGVPLQVETPGMMTGLAGIGYGLLRMAHPDRVPSVLGLQPPQRVLGD
jgi:type 2 lantibiotic biosynthesis protein LanM